MKLSFCVPVYNRADTLRRCVESLVGQTMASDDYEVIVVDDCSTDGSAELAEAVFTQCGFPHGRVVRLPVNSGGASVPRNQAVRQARGDYLFFVDSDDYVAPELAERVYDYATQNDADLVYVKYGVEGEGLIPPSAFAARGNLPQADLLDDKLLYATMVHKAFRRSTWNDLGIEFDPAIRVYEDLLVCVRFLMSTTRCSVLADQDYYIMVNQADHRLHDAVQPLDTTFRLYADALDAITASPCHDVTTRHGAMTRHDGPTRLRAAAVLVNRIMRYGPAADHPYLTKTCPPAEVVQWMQLWSTLLTGHLPPAADSALDPHLRNHVRALRRGDVRLARWANHIETLRPQILAKVLRRLLGYVLTW